MINFTNEDLSVLLSTAIAKKFLNWDNSKSTFWSIILFRDFLHKQGKRFPSLSEPFENLPLLMNKNPLKRYPAELFNQEILRWRLTIGK